MGKEKEMLSIIIDALNNPFNTPKTISAYRALLNWNALRPVKNKIKLSRKAIAEFSKHKSYLLDTHMLVRLIVWAVLNKKKGRLVNSGDDMGHSACIAGIVLTKDGVRYVYDIDPRDPTSAYEELLTQYVLYKSISVSGHGCRLRKLLKISADNKSVELL